MKLRTGARYMLRNGHAALIERTKTFSMMSGQTDNPKWPRKEREFPLFFGHCLSCGDVLSWQEDGSQGVGDHPNDIIGELDGAPQAQEEQA